MEFATEENAYLVQCHMESMANAAEENGLRSDIARRITWGIPDAAALRGALRRAFDECMNGVPPERDAAMERTARWFSPAYSAMLAVDGMRQYGIEPAWREPELPERHPRVAVCIPVLNYADLLRATLTRLEDTECDGMRVLIWDDGSTDGTRKVASERAWRMPVEAGGTTRRHGLLAARQALIDWALRLDPEPEFVLFLDGDMFSREVAGKPEAVDRLDPLWLRRLCALHIDGFTGPKLLTPDGRVWSAGGNVGANGSVSNIWLSGFLRDDGPQWNRPMLADFVPGACMLSRLELWRRIRCDTEYAGTICDDVDLAMQVQHIVGEHCWYRPEVALTHNAYSMRGQHHAVNQAAKLAAADACKVRFKQKWGRALGGERTASQSDIPSVFLAIPTYNYRELVLTCLDALRGLVGVNVTVCVHDDGSTDGTLDALHRFDAPWPFIPQGTRENMGLFHSRAALIETALAQNPAPEFLCFIDADCFSRGDPLQPYMPDPQWLAKLCRHHVNGCSTGMIHRADGRIWEAGLWWDSWAPPVIHLHARGRDEVDTGQYNTPCLCHMASGALMLFRTELFRSGRVRVDTSYGKRGYDDADLCMQITESIGERIWYWPDVAIVHNSWFQRQHDQSESAEWQAEFNKSRTRFLEKWGRKYRWHPTSVNS